MPHTRFRFDGESEESDFSETDMSMRGRNGRTSIHHRSSSRHRHPDVAKETFLAPVQQATRVYRSASTGGRRPRDRDDVPAVMIVNEQAQRTNNTKTNKSRRVQQKYEEDSDEEIVHLSRRRAASGVSREPSPYHRDYELAMNQHMLEKHDIHQDLEIFKHQQEIERLERELQKTREKSASPREHGHQPRESRLLRDEEEFYEEEISDRLRRLQRYERKNRSEEERRQAERQWRLRKFEEAEKEAADREELKAKLREEKLKEIQRQQEEDRERERLKLELKEQKLKELQKQKEEEEEREHLKKEILAEEARKAIEAEEKRKKEIAMKAAAVEEWKLEQERIAQKKKEEAEKRDKEFRERLCVEFGYSEEEIEEILRRKKREERKDEKKIEFEETKKTTWIKVHRKHLLPETLMAFNLPWDWDEHDTNYIIIKRWVTEDFQEELFAHSRRLREGKVITETSSSTTELKVNDRNKDKMYLVRKKSPSRRMRIFA
ncbi:uncharacterized protein N7498_009764 [Penicillium cinerascens]|uniref:CTLH domain-containing protein n=1 Tax=Penicillium cinerascens TaxID=70096 RepID=A0A9W9M6R2_9EURO|nr:uncharacterized protein N7498_009764 [Penicillium cinerascens]KAJ5190779.1 hypothetical protein N7498_009764 [Penicillium cinerascens]